MSYSFLRPAKASKTIIAIAMTGSVTEGMPRASPSSPAVVVVVLGHGSIVMLPWSVVDGGALAVVDVVVEELGGNVTGNPPALEDVGVGESDVDVVVVSVALGDGQSPPGTLAEAETLPPPPPDAVVVWAAAPPVKTRQAVKSNTNGVATRSAAIQTGQSR